MDQGSRMVRAEVSFHLSAALQAKWLNSFFELRRKIDPLTAMLLSFLPFGDSLRGVVCANATLVNFQRHIGIALAMELHDGALIAVMAGRPEEFTAHAANGYAGEITFWLFQFHIFNTVELVDTFALEEVGDRLFATHPNGTVGRNDIQASWGVWSELEFDVKAVTAGEHEARCIKDAVSLAGGAYHCGHGFSRFGFRFNVNADPWNWARAFILLWTRATIITWIWTAISITTPTAASVIATISASGRTRA